MKKRMVLRRSRGQVTLELALLFAALAAGFIALALYVQRGWQGYLKSNADSVGQQFSANNTWTSFARSSSQEDRSTVLSRQVSDACQGLAGVTNPDCSPGVLKGESYPDLKGVGLPQ